MEPLFKLIVSRKVPAARETLPKQSQEQTTFDCYIAPLPVTDSIIQQTAQ